MDEAVLTWKCQDQLTSALGLEDVVDPLQRVPSSALSAGGLEGGGRRETLASSLSSSLAMRVLMVGVELERSRPIPSPPESPLSSRAGAAFASGSFDRNAPPTRRSRLPRRIRMIAGPFVTGSQSYSDSYHFPLICGQRTQSQCVLCALQTWSTLVSSSCHVASQLTF